MRRIAIFALAACLGSHAVYAADTAWIQRAGGTATADSVDLRSSWVTDSDIPRLAQMRDLRRLDLSLTRISDRGLRALKTAPAIEELNLYFAEQAPWGLKSNLERMGAVLATTADVLRRAAIAAQAFIPTSAAKMLDMLAVPAGERLLSYAADPGTIIAAGTPLPAPEPVFRKFEAAKAG